MRNDLVMSNGFLIDISQIGNEVWQVTPLKRHGKEIDLGYMLAYSRTDAFKKAHKFNPEYIPGMGWRE